MTAAMFARSESLAASASIMDATITASCSEMFSFEAWVYISAVSLPWKFRRNLFIALEACIP